MQIEISPQEFSKFVINFLLDKIVNEDEVLSDDEELNKLNKVLKSKQVKTYLLKQYLDFDTQNRNYYRKVRDVFYTEKETDRRFTIVINPDKKDTNEDIENNENLLTEEQDVVSENKFCSNEIFYYIKDIVKNVIKRVRRKKFRSPRQMILDEDIEKIIENELNRRYNQTYGRKEEE